MTAPALAPMLAVSEYARRVREHLADLTVEEIAELTEGMEADLVEALLEIPSADALLTLDQVTARFGPPAAYAAELRSAAGLPAARGGARGAMRRLTPLTRLVDRDARLHGELRAKLQAQPWWPGFKELALTMRPAWWLVRAYVLAMLGSGWGEGPVPQSAGRWIVLVAFTVLSVQWGRGHLGQSRFPRTVGYIASGVAALSLLPVMNTVSAPQYLYAETWSDEESPVTGPGVFMDGEQVRSFHAFDADGNPIERFQLFDDLGRPVVTVREGREEFYVGGSDESWLASPPLDVYGRAAWNVYPLQLGRWNWVEWDEGLRAWRQVPGVELSQPPLPFERAIPLDQAAVGAPGGDVSDMESDDAAPDDAAPDDTPRDGDQVESDDDAPAEESAASENESESTGSDDESDEAPSIDEG